VTTSSDPDEIRREIERTQASLSQDVDALTEKVTPGKIVERRVDRARDAATKLKEKVMGSDPHGSGGYGGGGVRSAASQTADRVSGTASSAASSVQDAAASAAGTVQDVASTAADAVQQAPQAIRRQTRGNPLAAGLIAFGAGWLISSLLPASRQEQRLAQQATEKAADVGRPLADKARDAAMEIKDNLQEPAQEAVASVKDTATDAGRTVVDEGKSAAQDAHATTREAASSGGGVRQSPPGATYPEGR